jgi:hypothetical protein
MFDSHLPCRSESGFSRSRHSTAWDVWIIKGRHVGDLPAFSFFWLPCGVPRRLLSEAYQSQMQVASVLNCWTRSSNISGYHMDFHKGHGTVTAGQWRGMMCELMQHGMAGEQCGNGMGAECYVWLNLKWSLSFISFHQNANHRSYITKYWNCACCRNLNKHKYTHRFCQKT